MNSVILLPRFDRLSIQNYGLFPGKDNNGSLEIDFSNELTVIAGINGLGKTTILNLLLRLFTGPNDLTSGGGPQQYLSILPEAPTRLNRELLSYFVQRVADGADNATAELEVSFGKETVRIQRRLDNLSLVSFTVNSEAQSLDEEEFQLQMADSFNLASFVEVLLVLHNLVFFSEMRTGALWDRNAQRHILGAILLDKALSSEMSAAERKLNTCDSNFRNTLRQANIYRKELASLEALEIKSPETKAQLEATSVAISAAEGNLDSVESDLLNLGEQRRALRLEFEKAKLEQESASGSVERAKYTSLLNSFPSMEASARLHLSRILSESLCLVCGADAAEKRQELEELLVRGDCPACGAAEIDQDTSRRSKFEQVKMSSAVKKLELADTELRKAASAYEDVNIKHKSALGGVARFRAELEELNETRGELRAALPKDTERIQQLKSMLQGFDQTLKKEQVDLETSAQEYNELLVEVRVKIVKSARKLSNQFAGYVRGLLVEEAELVRDEAMVKIGQATGTSFEFPVFHADMSAADRPGLTARTSRDDVSESQRELIDLAFRLSLIQVAARGVGTFVMETPEASLDGLAMERVGATLREFCSDASKKLIVTNNLTNAGMVTALFGGPSKTKKERRRRFERVVNLLEEAKPNQALIENDEEYRYLLEEAVLGG